MNRNIHSVFRVSILVGLILLVSNFPAFSQESKNDGLFLLDDIDAQVASSEMINSIYNYDFEEVEKQYRKLKDEYGWHPMPYFLRSVAEWWKIEPNTDVKDYDETFLAYTDTAIAVAKGVQEIEKTKLEATFFLAAAHAFKGRLYSERKSWRKAAVEAKKSLNYVDECRKYTDLNPELLFGDGLYNYFASWIPENYPLLKPILLFFHKGDKSKGIAQLREAGQNAFYSRTEAQYFLARVLLLENKNTEEIYQLSEYLHETYPNNPSFHRLYARQLYSMGEYVRMEKECKSILENINTEKFGYGAIEGRYAAFFLGHVYESYGDQDLAGSYYKQVTSFVKQNKAYESGYHLYSLLGLMKIAVEKKNKEEAKTYFKEIRSNTKRKHPCFKKAKKLMKSI